MSPVSRAYDTGLDRPQRRFAREAILETLAPLAKPDGYVAAIIPFWKRITGKDDVSELAAELNGKDPAIAVVLGGGKASAIGVDTRKDQVQKQVRVYVYYLARNERGPMAALAGDVRSELDDRKNPGAEVMMEQAEQLLIGFQSADDGRGSVYKLVYEEEDEVESEGDYCLWEQVYSVRLDRRIDRRRAITQAVTLLHHETHDVSQPEAAIPMIVAETP